MVDYMVDIEDIPARDGVDMVDTDMVDTAVDTVMVIT